MFIRFFGVLTLFLCLSQTAFAQSIVMSDGSALLCYHSVKHGDPGRLSTKKTCKQALRDFDTSPKDKAATHVNLGILQMRSGKYIKAQKSFDKAISMSPNLPEAYINISAVLIYTGQHHAAIKSVERAIELGTKKMPEALYNRAMAYDNLENYTKAYADLKQALVLRPNWAPALKAIDNYEITPTPS